MERIVQQRRPPWSAFRVLIVFFFASRRAFETQMTRMEAEFVQREAPPSYGQLIAQGLIPPVDDFPAYNPTQVQYGPLWQHVTVPDDGVL